ncbi:hypothetical protein BKA08_003529 [Nocardioides marinisabuli]|uniref:Calcineurin-like phosphoesterase domain-containing protein n=1 Tax=Nocardioides marinisabuli TaxID=419476 RepID=A0A7Y9F4K3_9ACTN|nr:metallophosphoesterase [Nocardioides marinisabuli]NYD59291.1 hypothetical protein [Nocardioides marinisabuli]
MMLGLIGDLEGEREAAVDCLRLLGERGDIAVACQLGDLRFGYGPDPEGYLDAIESMCAEYEIELLCITGNHENWALLDALWADARWQNEDGTLRPIAVRHHVKMLPRGFRWQLGGRSFVALGSAPSVNRGLLTEGVDWWPSEALREEHVQATIAGGYADVMLTHDSPALPYCTATVADIMASNPMGWPDEILAYADDGIEKVTRAVLGVQPRLVAHGHFHVAGEAEVRLPNTDHNTTIWSLAARRDPGTLRVLDLDTLTDPLADPVS